MPVKGREGALALKARLGFVSRTLDGFEPTMIYTADGKTFDAEVAHPIHGGPFRPEITTVLDVVTRKAVGWSVDLSENTRTVADALRGACERHGIPAIFYTDRGAGYRNKQLDHASLGLCARLGVTSTHSLPYNSQARGIIEQVNGTVWNRLAKEYPSYMGAEMDRETAKAVFKNSRKAYEYITGQRKEQDPATREWAQKTYAKLIVGWKQFLDDVAEAIDVYNDEAHSSLKIRDSETGRMRKASPNEIWARFESTGFEAIKVEAEEADDLFRPFVIRKTRRGKVEFNKNHYSAPELERWHGSEVIVGYDIHDADKVWVREVEELDGETVAGRMICVASYFHNRAQYFPKTMVQASVEKMAIYKGPNTRSPATHAMHV